MLAFRNCGYSRGYVRLSFEFRQVRKAIQPWLFTTRPNVRLGFENARIFQSSGLEPNDIWHFGVLVVNPVTTIRTKPAYGRTTSGSWSFPTLQFARQYFEVGALEDHRYTECACGQFLAVLAVAGNGYEWLTGYLVVHVAALA